MTRVQPTVEVLRYSDPLRLSLAKVSAVFLGKDDVENIKRPITMLKHVPPHKSIFRGESVRFEFTTSKVVYDHLVTYTTANVRACAGLRANKAGDFVVPLEVVDTELEPIIEQVGSHNLKNYHDLIAGVDPETQDPIKKARLQSARSVSPTSVTLHYILEFNFLTLMEAIFPQRVWGAGAQPDTKEVVQMMWEQVRAYDPELWDTADYVFGTESINWTDARFKLDRRKATIKDFFLWATSDDIGLPSDVSLKEALLMFSGKTKSMWDK